MNYKMNDYYMGLDDQETILKAVKRLTKYWTSLVEKHGIIAIDEAAFRNMVEGVDFVFSVEYAHLVTDVYKDCEACYLKEMISPNQTIQHRLNGLLTCALKRYMNKENIQNRNYKEFCKFAEALLQKEEVTMEWQLMCFQHRDEFFHSHMNHVYGIRPIHVTTQYHPSFFQDATALLSSFDTENL